MSRAPDRVDFARRARESFDAPPDWVMVLAEFCNGSTLATAGKRIGYAPSTVSQVISNSYRGDLTRVAEKVRGAMMQAVVDCPILGEIGRDRCLDEQDQPFRATSAMRAQLFHACRSGCPHSKHTRKHAPHQTSKGDSHD